MSVELSYESKLLKLQVLCWGIRDMKHYHWLPVTSPMVEIECGGVAQHSHHIKDANKNPNFHEPVSFDVVSCL